MNDAIAFREAAAKILDQLLPSDRMGIFSTSGTINQDFTSDKAALLRSAEGDAQTLARAGDGWHVAFADGFATAIGSGLGQDNLWQMPSGYEPAENSNDLNVYSASQVRVGANGLELAAHNQPNVGGTGKNYVSGAIYTIGRFSLRSYAGATFAVECVCRWPRNGGAADPAQCANQANVPDGVGDSHRHERELRAF